MKTLSKIFGITLALSACTSWFNKEVPQCPNVQIPRSTAYVTQVAGYSDELKIEVIGYEGYCINANSINRRYASIRPIFRVQRLSEGHDSRVDVSYYTETVQGPPEFLGRRNYHATFDMPLNVNEKRFTGGEVRVRVPTHGYNDFAILLGMNMSALEYDQKQKSFDVEYRYLSSGEIEEYSRPLNTKVIEVDDAPEVQYHPMQPLPIRQDGPQKSSCSSCSL